MNLLDKVPKSVQGRMKADLREISAALTRAAADKAIAVFVEKHEAAAAPVRPISADTVLSNAGLQRLGGYRTGLDSTLGGFSYRDALNTFEMIPGESNAQAGHRLAKECLTEPGIVFRGTSATGALDPLPTDG